MTIEGKLEEYEAIGKGGTFRSGDAFISVEGNVLILELVAMLKKAIEQRDGFMKNYHAATGIYLSERVQIYDDCNAELLRAGEGGKS